MTSFESYVNTLFEYNDVAIMPLIDETTLGVGPKRVVLSLLIINQQRAADGVEQVLYCFVWCYLEKCRPYRNGNSNDLLIDTVFDNV